MFRGINSVNIDSKGRMAVPARYRPLLQISQPGQLVITIDPQESCLWLYPLSIWEDIEARIEALPSFNATTKRIKRLLIGHATEVDLDTQGRILVPTLLRDYADLSKQVMLVGQGNKFEVWAEPNWEKQRKIWLKQASSDIGDVPQELGDLAI